MQSLNQNVLNGRFTRRRVANDHYTMSSFDTFIQIDYVLNKLGSDWEIHAVQDKFNTLLQVLISAQLRHFELWKDIVANVLHDFNIII